MRQLKRKFPARIKGCRSNYGDVVIYTVNSGNYGAGPGAVQDRKTVINTKEGLEAFASDVLKFNLAELSIVW